MAQLALMRKECVFDDGITRRVYEDSLHSTRQYRVQTPRVDIELFLLVGMHRTVRLLRLLNEKYLFFQ